MAFDFITKDRFSALESFALAEPPTWTRLEPQSTAGDPRPGVEARVHDPLWMLGRQWQLGEFEGEDAGTPLTVRVVTRTTSVDRWAPAPRDREDADAIEVHPLGSAPQDLLEPFVEFEPVEVSSPGLRARAEAGAALLSAIDEAGLSAHGATIIARCPLDLNPHSHPGGDQAALDPQWLRLLRMLGDAAMADAETFSAALESAKGLPAWLAPGDKPARAALRKVINPWLAWYRGEVSPLPGGQDAWMGDRLEYRFNIAAGDKVFAAPSHDGGDVEWHSFEPAPDTTLTLPPDVDPAEETRAVHALLASPLRYAGMPADRLWEMEDSQVNLGVVEAEPWDLARLLVAEFALTYGNDWIVVPVDVPFGSLTTVESVVYTTTFGEHFVVKPTTEVSPDGRWRMFTIANPADSIDGLLVPPGAVAVQDGPPIEEVILLRDEMANMVWAVERAVQGPSGSARDRARETGDVPKFNRGPVNTAQLDYQLQSGVPARWIPFLPRSSGYRAIDLVQGRMTSPDGTPIPPLGRTLNRPDLAKLKDAEVPREGVLVRRHFSIMRRADGSYLRWTTRRVGVGRGEGASQLSFDSAIPRKAQPNS
jgi:hypothetical protein